MENFSTEEKTIHFLNTLDVDTMALRSIQLTEEKFYSLEHLRNLITFC